MALHDGRTVLERAVTPHGEIQLQTRLTPQGELAYEIILNGVFIMASYNQRSERALAILALERGGTTQARRDQPAEPSLRVLVGGLGMGFTAQAALSWPGVVAVDVVELEETLIGWNRRCFCSLNGRALDDPRLRLVQADITDWLATASGPYDAICLDVDNGPHWLVRPENARLYGLGGLRRLRGVSGMEGVLTVWSAGADAAFHSRLRTVFGQAEAIAVPETDPWGHLAEAVIYRAARLEWRPTAHV